MKKILLTLFMFVSISTFSQQYDMLFATVKHDTVTILDSNAWRNCVAEMNIWHYYINNNQIKLYETDTIYALTTCGCLLDFKVTIAGLTNANYVAEIYQFYSAMPQDTTYIGSVNFTISNKKTKDTSYIINEYVNPCHSFDNISEMENEIGISLFPNPMTNEATVKFDLPMGINNGAIVFYNLQGNVIKRFTIDRTFTKLLISTTDIASGMYYYQLQTTSQNSVCKKLIVIK